MTLQASGAISMSQIRTEFGGSAPDNLSEYYRGGGLVPDTPNNASIPTSGAIKMSDFYGTSNIAYGLPTAASDASAGVTATATLTMNSGGTYSCAGATLGVTQSGNWVTPTSEAPGSYTIRMHVDGGSTPSGPAMDTDHALTSNRVWSVSQAAVGTNSVNVTLTLKDGGGTTVATQSFSFNATRAI